MMNYRQWKKNYKKNHGYNPPVKEDRRRWTKVQRIARSIRTGMVSAVSIQSLLSAKHLIEARFNEGNLYG